MTDNTTTTNNSTCQNCLREIADVAEVAIVISCVLFVLLWFIILNCIANREQQRILAMQQAARANDVQEQRQTKMERLSTIHEKLLVHDWKENHRTDVSYGGESFESAPRRNMDRNNSNETFLLDKLQQMSKLGSVGEPGGGDVTVTSFDSLDGEDDEDKDEECAICLLKFEKGDRVCESNNTACHHVFHEDCMTRWLLKQDLCPICRCTYLEGPA